MKKHSLFLATVATLFATSCVTPDTSYTIDGEVADSLLNGKTVYLSILPTEEAIDSTTIVNGQFQLTGKIDTAQMVTLSVERLAMNFVLEPGKIAVDLENDVVSGTPLNESYTQFKNEIILTGDNFRAQRDSIIRTSANHEEAMKAIQDVYENQYLPNINSLFSQTFDNNRNNTIGALVISYWELEPAQFDSVLNLAGDVLKASPIITQIIEEHNILKKTAEGQPFTDFTIEQPDGTKVSLSDYVGKGKYVLVDFWASWCGPCRREIPNIKEIYDQYRGDHFEVISVAVWDKVEKSQEAIKELGMDWPQILNAQSIPTELYGIKGIPHIILFGPDGTIIARDLREQAMKDKVAEVMAK